MDSHATGVLFLFALLGPWARRGGGDGALHARLGGRLGLRALLDVHLDVALELADVLVARAGADERADGVGGGRTGTPRDTMSASTVNGSVRERRSPDCFFIFPSSTAGTPAWMAEAAALISSVVATEPSARCALPHLEGERAHGEHDARTVSAHGQPLIHLLHQRLDGDDPAPSPNRRARRAPCASARRAGCRYEDPGPRRGANAPATSARRQNTTSRTSSHLMVPSTTSALLGMPKSSPAERGAVGSATHCLPFTRNA